MKSVQMKRTAFIVCICILCFICGCFLGMHLERIIGMLQALYSSLTDSFSIVPAPRF